MKWLSFYSLKGSNAKSITINWEKNSIENTQFVISHYVTTMQDKAMEVVLNVIQAFKSSEVEAVVKKLNQEQLDVLMKYLYRGFERPAETNNAQLLLWHDKVCAEIYKKLFILIIIF